MKERFLTYETERDDESKMLEALSPEEKEKYLAKRKAMLDRLNKVVREIREIWEKRKNETNRI